MALENIFSLLTLLVAAAAAVGAFYSVYTARKTAKQRTTLEFLEKYKSDVRVYKSRLFTSVFEDKKDASPVLAQFEKMEFLLVFLNKFEMLAIGLKHKIYDEDMIFDALALEMIQIYELSEPFIEETRENMRSKSKNYEEIFVNFERLVGQAKARLAQK